MSVCALAFLEKQRQVSLYPFLFHRTVAHFPWLRPISDLSYCTFSLGDLVPTLMSSFAIYIRIDVSQMPSELQVKIYNIYEPITGLST